VEELAVDDVRAELPRFHSANIEKNLRLGSALGAIARRKNATLAQLSIAWTIAQGSRAGAFIVPIPGAKSRKHIEENVRAADIALTADDLAEIGSHRTARRRVRRPLSDRTNAPTEHLRLVGQEATQNDARTRVSLCGFPYAGFLITYRRPGAMLLDCGGTAGTIILAEVVPNGDLVAVQLLLSEAGLGRNRS
jgi:hypothetical protein